MTTQTDRVSEAVSTAVNVENPEGSNVIVIAVVVTVGVLLLLALIIVITVIICR